MKRTTKTLLVFLIVMLVLAATAATALVSAAGTVTGITTKRNQDYQGMSLNWGKSATDSVQPTGDKYSWQVSGRVGTASIGSTPDGNRYVVFTQTPKVAASGPYFGSGYGGSGTTARASIGADGNLNIGGDISKYPYLVFDFDVMSPTGKYIHGAAVDLQLRSIDATKKTNVIVSIDSVSSAFKFGSDSKGSFIYLNTDIDGTKTYVDPTEFIHVTAVYESVATASARTVNGYFYVNGKLWQSTKGKAASVSYYQSIPHMNYDEVRLNFTTTDDATQAMAFDNVVTRVCDTTYNGNLASVLSGGKDITEWESNIYDASKMPLGRVAAKNLTTGKCYTDGATAISEASSGDSVRLYEDLASGVTVSKPLTVLATDESGTVHTCNITAGSGYTVNTSISGVYVVESSALPLYQYTSGGKTVTATEETSLATVVSAADSGSTVYVKKNVKLSNPSVITVGKNLTIDLCGNTMAIALGSKTSAFNVSGSCSLTFKNGTIISEYASTATAGLTYPLVGMSTSSKLYLENVNTYTAAFAWSYGGHNTVVSVKGGEHHIDRQAADVSGGFFESRSNTTFTATDATFHMGKKGEALFSSLHYKAENANLATKKSTFTYNNCKIYGDDNRTQLVAFMNEFTTLYFNNCDLYGSINPVLHSWEVSQTTTAIGPAREGSIILGDGCRISDMATYASAVTYSSGFHFSEQVTTVEPEMICYTGTLAEGNLVMYPTVKTITFTHTVVPASEYDVNWYAIDGKTVIKSEKVKPGELATPPEYSPSGSNGYFSCDYDGWSASFCGTKTSDFTVTADMDFYPAPSSEITVSLTSARYNLSLIGSIGINLYLPEINGKLNLKGVYDENDNEIFGEKVFIGSVSHTLYKVGEVGATSLHESKTVTVSFDVSGKTLSQTLNLSPYKYAKAILDNSKSEYKSYPDSAYTLVADMIRYSVNLGSYVAYAGGSSVDKSISVLYSEYNSLCSTLLNDFSDTGSVDVSGLIGYVSSVAYEVSAYQPSYKLTFKSGSGVVDAYVTVEGYYKNEVGGANWGSVTYKATDKVTYSGTDNLSSASIRNIPMYNMDKDITITVLLSNGTLKSGVYSINGYYNNVSVSTLEKARLSAFLGSMRSFADSAAKYRHATEIITAENAVDFRNCDHTQIIEVPLAISKGFFAEEYKTAYCASCDTHFVRYSDFGAKGDGVTNDFLSIRRAHKAANMLCEQYSELNIVVSSGKGTFYIGDPDDNGLQAISVVTSVDWDGAHFIIDDVEIDLDGEERPAAKQSIFELLGIDAMRGENYTAYMPYGVPAGATNVGFAPGRTIMLKLTNRSVKHYIRQGINENSGQNQTECIIVDAYGNVDPTTPVQWDYTATPFCKYKCAPVDTNSDGKCDTCSTAIGTSFGASAYTADDKPIIISGLDKDGNINCKWETRTSTNVSLETYNQVVRNINVHRSNTTVEGIDRIFVEDDTNSTPRQTYAAFVNVDYAYNTVMKDMLVNQHLSHYQTNGALLGSYEFGGNSSINTSWINCKIKNFFNSNGKVTYRGMFGSNYMRNSYLKGCVLTSFDSHSGAYNVTIEDSTFEHINYVGGGEVIMRNVTVYVDGGYAACILRQDYGSMWDGDIKIDGLTLLHSSSYGRSYIDIVRAYYTNWYFGYTSHLPGKIYVNNAQIKQYTRSSASYTMGYGTIVEPNLSSSSKKLGIHGQINSQMTNDYDYSTANANNLDPKVCTEAVYITNSNVTIYYPDHWYFKNMKVYVDGVQQNWFKVRSGLHKDANGDKVCDNGCGQPLG